MAANAVLPARIVLGSADGLAVAAIARETGIAKPTVWSWQRLRAEDGVNGPMHDKTRPPGRNRLAADKKANVPAKTETETPPSATR